MIIDILGGSAEQKYKSLNSQRSVNWYMVPSTMTEKNKSQQSMFPTPGMTLFATATGRYHRGAFVAEVVGQPARCFFVIDTTLYELKQDTSIISRGSLTNMASGWSKVWFATNGNAQMFIGQGNVGYNYDLTTDTLTYISDIDFPGCQTAAYMDGYLILTNNGRTYFNNVLNDFTSWDGTDVLTPPFKADPVIAVSVIKEELYNFGTQTIEPYLNDGTSPFSRRTGATSIIGLAAVGSLCVFNDGHFFLGRNELGQFAFYHVGYDYNISQISDFSRNWQFNLTTETVKDCEAFITYTKDGHIWYHVTFPGLETTYVYDVLTKDWFERKSMCYFEDSDGTPLHREFRGRFHVNFNGMNLYFDKYSGKIFLEDYTVQTEDGLMIIRDRISKVFSEENKIVSTSELEIDYNAGESATLSGQGSSPLLMLSISKDGGRTFGAPRYIPLGQVGQYIKRAKTNRLGAARNWVLRLTLSDPINLMLISAIAQGSVNGPVSRG